MTERGILFSGAMVRALLDGSKTQTRRVCKPMQQWVDQGCREVRTHEGAPHHFLKGAAAPLEKLRCPYGQPGDRLWVRETWQGPLFDGDLADEYRAGPEKFNRPEYCQYAADGGPAPEFMTMDDELVCRWRPSIHMPRWASRILLEITSVRVERLQDINEADAYAEGVEPVMVPVCCGEPHREDHGVLGVETCCCGQPIEDEKVVPAYRALWESLNGAGSWDANPWVWVVEFRRIES